jgi:hypothetical protein
MTDPMKVFAIEAAVHNGSAFVLRKDNDLRVVASASEVIQRALIDAFLTRAEVKVETVGKTWIKRVEPFAAGTGGAIVSPGPYVVSRLATQRGADGMDHLEAFLMKQGDAKDQAYNIYDPLLQQIFTAAFLRLQPTNLGLYVEFDGDEVVAVRIGEP